MACGLFFILRTNNRKHLQNVFWPWRLRWAIELNREIPLSSSGFDPQELLKQAGNPALAGKLTATWG